MWWINSIHTQEQTGVVDEKTHIMSDLHFKVNLNWSAYRHKTIKAEVNTLALTRLRYKYIWQELGKRFRSTEYRPDSAQCALQVNVWVDVLEGVDFFPGLQWPLRKGSYCACVHPAVHVCVNTLVCCRVKELAVKPDPTCATLAVCNGRALGMSWSLSGVWGKPYRCGVIPLPRR